jgi:hypothetical protein
VRDPKENPGLPFAGEFEAEFIAKLASRAGIKDHNRIQVRQVIEALREQLVKREANGDTGTVRWID